jgi:hypothetical protein
MEGQGDIALPCHCGLSPDGGRLCAGAGNAYLARRVPRRTAGDLGQQGGDRLLPCHGVAMGALPRLGRLEARLVCRQ